MRGVVILTFSCVEFIQPRIAFAFSSLKAMLNEITVSRKMKWYSIRTSDFNRLGHKFVVRLLLQYGFLPTSLYSFAACLGLHSWVLVLCLDSWPLR